LHTIEAVAPGVYTGVELLTVVGLLAPQVGTKINIRSDAILLMPQDGGSATCLSTLDTSGKSCWVSDESQRVLWVGLPTGGPVRIAVVE
jgi:hypothetical protein